MSPIPVKPEKNLHAAVPSSLLLKAEKAAQAESITFDEPEEETLEIALSPIRIPLQDLFADLE